MNKIYNIHCEKNSFSIVPELGALGISLKLPVQGEIQEILYTPDDFWEQESKEWQGGFPFCFPICGRLQQGELPLHGFAPYMPWEVLDHQESKIVLRLSDTVETQAMYPYAFEVLLTYEISKNDFQCEFTCRNLSDGPMPYYAGFHPYFLTPMKIKDQIKVMFEPQKRLKYNEQLDDVIGELPVSEFPSVITSPELNEQLNFVKSPNNSQLIYPQGHTIDISFIDQQELFCYIQMYTQEDKPFFCVEPWMNQPNAYNKQSVVRALSPGDADSSKIIIKII